MINPSDYSDKEDGESLDYVVLEEKNLGYLYRWGDYFFVGVLGHNVLRGGRRPDNGPVPLVPFEYYQPNLRLATQADFDEYRVYSTGLSLGGEQ